MRRLHGFTLIEMVMIILVVSVGMLALANLFGGNSRTLVINESVQKVAQYAQACAERILEVRRDNTFSAASSTTICAEMPGSPSVSGTSVTGTSSSACPNGFACRNVTVTVRSGSVSSVITLMLVDY